MGKRTLIVITVIVVLIAIGITVAYIIFFQKATTSQSLYRLTVQVTGGFPIPGLTIGRTESLTIVVDQEINRIWPFSSKRKRITSRKTDELGKAEFLLPPGRYICYVSAGDAFERKVTGGVSVNLRRDASVELRLESTGASQ